MSHVTLEQAKKLYSLGFPLCKQSVNSKIQYDSLGEIIGYEEKWETETPTSEELMEWLKDKILFLCTYYADAWHVGNEVSDADLEIDFNSPNLIDCLYECTCWVLEGKK